MSRYKPWVKPERAEPTVEVPPTVVAASAASAHQVNYHRFRKLNFLLIATGIDTFDKFIYR